MKKILLALLSLNLAMAQETTLEKSIGDGVFIVPRDFALRTTPALFSVTADTKVQLFSDRIETETTLVYRQYQGNPDVMSIALQGKGEVTSVTGEQMKDWSIRVDATGQRFLDLRTIGALPLEKLAPPAANQWTVIMKSKHRIDRAGSMTVDVLLPSAGAAVGFSQKVTIIEEGNAMARVIKAEGLSPVEHNKGKEFVGATIAKLSLDVSGNAQGLSVKNAQLYGTLSKDGKSVSFILKAEAEAREAGAVTELLGGTAALTTASSGDGWHISLRAVGEGYVYDLIADRVGNIPLEILFDVPISRNGDWKIIDFNLPAGIVVPLWLQGLTKSVEFDEAQAVVPVIDATAIKGFLPADGHAAVAWRDGREIADGALFFSSSEVSDVRIGSGLVRQASMIDFRVLQGKLSAVNLTITGPGEILSVTGEHILGWNVSENDGKKTLALQLNRPWEGAGRIIVETQAPLGDFPVKTTVMRLSPQGSLRHSGWLRVANEGAVKIEVSEPKALIQLAPEQFPIADAELRQAFVFRFPAEDYSYQVNADHVLPETTVTETTIYELAETDRKITTDLELDIREAPLREWEMEVPSDYAVVSVTGAAVADYTLATEAVKGYKRLKILFAKAVLNRQLISLRLEKNEPAKAGEWVLPALNFPMAKSRRGNIGVVAASGYRLVSGEKKNLTEIPLNSFTPRIIGLQQAYRLRDSEWSAKVTAEALGQSIVADVFHLYSVKEGAVFGSVLINYFVVGAPASEWRIQVPKGIGNIDVTGQNIGHDWRKDDDVLVVPLASPLLGSGTVLVTFEQAMEAAGGAIAPGEIRPLNVQSERGFIQVVSPLQVKVDINKTEGPVLPLQVNELPTEYRMLSSAPTLATWEYTARDFSIVMNLTWFKAGETVEQVVDFIKLNSHVSRDGQVVTDARFFVKSKHRDSLRMKLPAGAILLETKVNQVTANPRTDQGDVIVPLPMKHDLNQAVEIAIRYGVQSSQAAHVKVAAPILFAPAVMGEWTVVGDEGRQLVPRGGTVEMVREVMLENGIEWLSHRPMISLIYVSVLIVVLVMLFKNRLKTLAILLVLVASLLMFMMSLDSYRQQSSVINYVAPVVGIGSEMSIVLDNVSPEFAKAGLAVWIGVCAGFAALGYGFMKKDRWWLGGGALLLSIGMLSIRGNVGLFFLVVSASLVIHLLAKYVTAFRKKSPPVVNAVAPLFAVAFFFCSSAWHRANAADDFGVKTISSMTYDCSIKENRLYGSIDIVLRAEAGDRFRFLQAPAVLGEFTSDGLQVVSEKMGEQYVYVLLAKNAGLFTAKAMIEMPLENPQQPWILPGSAAAMRQLTLRWDQGGWEFDSPAAAHVQLLDGLSDKQSGAIMVLRPMAQVQIMPRAKQRDVATEKPVFFVESAQLMTPLPGVVNGRHKMQIRPTQGRISELVLRVPKGFTVSDVSDGPTGVWRFDPEKLELRVAIEPAQDQAFSFTVDTQRGSAVLPVDVNLEPLRVMGNAGEVGMMALAFGEDSQLEKVETEGLSTINPEDFDQTLLSRDKAGHALTHLQQVYRFGAPLASAKIRVAAVAPEMRTDTWQLLTLADDRVLLAADVNVLITRAGIFRLQLEIPEGLEVESASGDSLSHWTESNSAGKRLMTLHLTGRTIGAQLYHLTFTGAGTGQKKKWPAPRIVIRDTTRESGIMTIVPERGMRIGVVARDHVSPMDHRELFDVSARQKNDAGKAGALVFRLLQRDWQLDLLIDPLEPWVTAQVLHDAVMREGQMTTKASVIYQVENASLKSMRVRIPGLSDQAAATIRASGKELADFIKVAGEKDVWEIRFQKGISATTQVDIEFQQQLSDESSEKITPILLEKTRQVAYYVTVRSAGRLELAVAKELPEGWQMSDWSVIQSSMPKLRSQTAPALTFKVTDGKTPLLITLQRHDLADVQKMRVAQGSLTSLISPTGAILTAVVLRVEVAEKGTIRLRLPANSSLYNVLVNDEGAALVREVDDWLFYAFPSPIADEPAIIRFVYSSSAGKNFHVEGPSLNIPMENLTWRILVPDGWKLKDHRGDFDLKNQAVVGRFQLEDYQSFVSNQRASSSASAVALLDQANDWIVQGDQEKASMALGNAARNNMLDQASNEDARVQLRELKTQQAVLGLNTRRQKLMLDNRAEGIANNEQMEQAATVNPVLKGQSNYDPKQFDRFLEGNSADENAALKAIANRIVTQQLAAEPVPSSLEVNVPERGSVLTFGRSVQVDGAKPLVIDLDMQRNHMGFVWIPYLLCGLLALFSTLLWKKCVRHG